jgi:hypothetical protein
MLLAAVSWTVGNALGELTRRAAPDRVVRLRYEDLREDPAAALRAIGAAFGLPVDDVVAKLLRGEAFPVGTNVGGNHIRHEGVRALRPPGVEARPPLPRWAELATVALCWPLMRQYGYLPRLRPTAGVPAEQARLGASPAGASRAGRRARPTRASGGPTRCRVERPERVRLPPRGSG